MGLFNDLGEFRTVSDNKRYLTAADLKNQSLIGTWSGRSKLYGDIDLGFDTSKGLLYNIRANLVSSESGYTFNHYFWITKLIPQNTEINLAFYSDVVNQKHFNCDVKINKNILTIVTNGTKISVYIVKLQCYGFLGYLSDRIGPAGIPGPKGDSIPIDSDGNYDVENKKLVNLQIPTDNNDAVSKTYVDTKDASMKTYVDNGDLYHNIATLNEFNLESRDFSNSDNNLQVFDFGGYRDFSKKYHKAKSHAILTLSGSPCVMTVTLRNLSSGHHALRIESIINDQDDHSQFDTDVTMTSDNNISILSTNKIRHDRYAIILNLLFQLTADMSQYNIDITFKHQANKEIALFIYGRRGRGHVNPMIIDNINYQAVSKQYIQNRLSFFRIWHYRGLTSGYQFPSNPSSGDSEAPMFITPNNTSKIKLIGFVSDRDGGGLLPVSDGLEFNIQCSRTDGSNTTHVILQMDLNNAKYDKKLMSIVDGQGVKDCWAINHTFELNSIPNYSNIRLLFVGVKHYKGTPKGNETTLIVSYSQDPV